MALYGPDGFPVYSERLLDAAREDGSRPAWMVRSESIRKSINTMDWRTVVSASCKLYENMGVPRGAIRQKADFAIGEAWGPIFLGADKEWGKLATEWLTSIFYPVCELRGGAFDFVSTLNVDSITIDREGGYGVLLTETEDGFPQTQRIPIHRFGARWDSQEVTLTEGPYKGCLLHQGVIRNSFGRPVAYRIYEDTLEPYLLSSKFQDISARDMAHVYEADWHGMSHGMPAFIHALNDLRDCKQSKEWEQHSMLIASSIGLIEESESGAADPNDAGARTLQTDSARPPISIQEYAGGTVMHYRANTGAGLRQFVTNKPGEDWERFNDRLIRGALYGINWPYAFAWKSEGTGTDSREDVVQARASVSKRQRVLRPVARRIVGYAISKAIKRGDLPEYKGADLGGFLRWDFQMPARMTVDDGREAGMQLDALKMGTTTEDDIAAANGRTGNQVRTQRELEVDDLLDRAKRIADKHGITLDQAASYLQQRSPNPPVSAGKPLTAGAAV